MIRAFEKKTLAYERTFSEIKRLSTTGALKRALDPASDGDHKLVPRVRLRGRSGRWLTLHASLTEPTPGVGARR